MMHLCLSKFIRNDKGATAVEFAIILPVLLLFIFGILEWGLYMYNRQVITNAAREGARHGVLMRMTPRDKTVEDDAICNRVLSFAGTYLVTFGSDELSCDNGTDGDYGNIMVERDPDNLAFETDLTVSIDYQYRFLFLHTFRIGPLPISTEATMRME